MTATRIPESELNRLQQEGHDAAAGQWPTEDPLHPNDNHLRRYGDACGVAVLGRDLARTAPEVGGCVRLSPAGEYTLALGGPVEDRLYLSQLEEAFCHGSNSKRLGYPDGGGAACPPGISRRHRQIGAMAEMPKAAATSCRLQGGEA